MMYKQTYELYLSISYKMKQPLFSLEIYPGKRMIHNCMTFAVELEKY